MEWTLARNGSPFLTCYQENLDSSTPDPVPSPPSLRCAERIPEPAATDKPSPHGETEPWITSEPELLMMSVKVREPATTPTSRERVTDGVSTERSSTPCTVAEGELSMVRGLCHSKGERAPLHEFSTRRAPVPAPGKCSPDPVPLEHPPVSAPVPEFSPGSPKAQKCPPFQPLLLPPPMSSGSPSAPPQPTIYGVRARWDCHPPALLWSEFPSTLPPRPGLKVQGSRFFIIRHIHNHTSIISSEMQVELKKNTAFT